MLVRKPISIAALEESSIIIGPLAFFAYMLFLIIIIANLFLSIMINSYHEMTENNLKLANIFKMDGLDYILIVILRFLGIDDPPNMFEESEEYEHSPCKY